MEVNVLYNNILMPFDVYNSDIQIVSSWEEMETKHIYKTTMLNDESRLPVLILNKDNTVDLDCRDPKSFEHLFHNNMVDFSINGKLVVDYYYDRDSLKLCYHDMTSEIVFVRDLIFTCALEKLIMQSKAQDKKIDLVIRYPESFSKDMFHLNESIDKLSVVVDNLYVLTYSSELSKMIDNVNTYSVVNGIKTYKNNIVEENDMVFVKQTNFS